MSTSERSPDALVTRFLQGADVRAQPIGRARPTRAPPPPRRTPALPSQPRVLSRRRAAPAGRSSARPAPPPSLTEGIGRSTLANQTRSEEHTSELQSRQYL